jgi:hypothetical protein
VQLDGSDTYTHGPHNHTSSTRTYSLKPSHHLIPPIANPKHGSSTPTSPLSIISVAKAFLLFSATEITESKIQKSLINIVVYLIY